MVCNLISSWEENELLNLRLDGEKTMTTSKKKRFFHLSLAGICFSLTFFSSSFPSKRGLIESTQKRTWDRSYMNFVSQSKTAKKFLPGRVVSQNVFVVVRSHIPREVGRERQFPVSSLTFPNTYSWTLDTFFKVILSAMVKGKADPVEELSLSFLPGITDWLHDR